MFFFFKQKTADEMRISDWSSDVCSSDLAFAASAGTLVVAVFAFATLPLRWAHRLFHRGIEAMKSRYACITALAALLPITAHATDAMTSTDVAATDAIADADTLPTVIVTAEIGRAHV